MKYWHGAAERARRIFMSVAILLAGCALAGCTPRSANTHGNETAADSSPNADLTDEAREWADSALATLTLEERIGQLIMPSIPARADAAQMARLRSYALDHHVGGIVLLRGDVASAAILADSIRHLLPTGAFVAIDAEWGLAMRLDSAPAYTPNAQLPDATDDQLMFDYGRSIAAQCRRLGINMVLGPVADVATAADAPLAPRSFGADPQRVADFSAAYARGLEAGGVASVAKHFPGLGASHTDTHRSTARLDADASAIRATHLLPFRRYIDAGLSGIMVGHVAVPALDPSGLPASISPRIMGAILRDSLQFHGLILTDALNMGGAADASAARAIAAGADIVLCPADTRAAVRSLLDAVADGTLSAAVVADRARRVLFFKRIFSAATPARVAPARPSDLSSL